MLPELIRSEAARVRRLQRRTLCPRTRACASLELCDAAVAFDGEMLWDGLGVLDHDDRPAT